MNAILVEAESTNGTSWSAPTPITIDGSVNQNAVDPNVLILPNGEYLLTYTYGNFNFPNPSLVNTIYTAISTDGINFTDAQPAFTNTSGAAFTDPTEVQLQNGTFLLGVASPVGAIGSLLTLYTSTDGRNFTPNGVTIPNEGSADLLLLPNGGVRLFYAGGPSGIGSEISYDGGQTWTVEAGVRLSGNYLDPSVVETAPGLWEMVVKSFINPSTPTAGPSNHELSLATSTDGLTFTITQPDFVVQGSVGEIVADPAVNVATSPTVSSISAVTDTNTNYASTGHLVTITMTTSEAVTVTGTPTLQLSDNEVATYSGGSGTNTLIFTYVVQPRDSTTDLQVTGLNLPSGAGIQDQAGVPLWENGTGDLGILINNAINDSITELYIGYYNRAPDPAGETYWVGQLQGGMSLSAIAQSYSVQTESTNLYPFLASPNTASTVAVQAFVTSVYENLFNRAPDPAGEAYWVSQLQTGASTVGGAIINIISGAQLNDLVTINNKVTVGDYYDTQIFNNNVQFSDSVALSALGAVTFDTSSIAAAETIINAYVTGQVYVGYYFPTTSNVNYVLPLSNVAPAFTLNFPGGYNILDAGVVITHSQATGDSLSINYNGTGSGYLTLESLISTSDTTISIASNNTAASSNNLLYQINETNNALITVTITGSSQFVLGNLSPSGAPNLSDGIVTDSAIAAASSATTTASSLTLIDASATTGGVDILAGASNVAGGAYVKTGMLSADNMITYTGLTIKGGSGQDKIENDANNGVVTDGNHNGDVIYLGGSGASATFDAGANDTVYVGQSEMVTGIAGNALGGTVTFGAGATAVLHIGVGAEAGSSATTSSIGQTTVNGAAAGIILDFTQVISSSLTVNENAAVASATSLTNAENAAANALGFAGVAYFNYSGNEYVVAVHAAEGTVSSADAVVELVGITNHSMTNTAGVVTLA
jgi:hypothetical protein